MRSIKIFDTTLRDGEQAPGCGMDIADKIEIAKTLERLRVDVIEAGFAASSKGDADAVKAVSSIAGCCVSSLARALTQDIDAAYEALKQARQPRIHIFLATSPVHLKYKLKMTPERMVELAAESVAYAKKYCSDIEFSAEDAMRSEPELVAKAVRAAVKAGASVINIPDTVGYACPADMSAMIKYVLQNGGLHDGVTLSAHCHNDLGMAVANSLAAVEAGAGQVECTVNGIGERAGNAALEEIVMALSTRGEYFNARCGVDTKQIMRASRLVYSIIGMPPPINKPIVGANAFSHESGIHQHGMISNRATYEIITPDSVGLTSENMVLGKHSGRHAVETRLGELGFTLSGPEIDGFMVKFKEIADRKKTISDNDLEAIAKHRPDDVAGGLKLLRFTVNSGNYVTSNAVIRLLRGTEECEDVAIGDGPIDAAFNAIDKIADAPAHTLDDYAIHSVSEGKDALGEVIIKLRCENRIFTGRGLSTDIIEASILAYINGLNKLSEGKKV